MRFGVKISAAAVLLAGLAFALPGCSRIGPFGPAAPTASATPSPTSVECFTGSTQSHGKEWEESPLKKIPMPTFGDCVDFSYGTYDMDGYTQERWAITFKNVELDDAVKYVEDLEDNKAVMKKYPWKDDEYHLTKDCSWDNYLDCDSFYHTDGSSPSRNVNESLHVEYHHDDDVGFERTLQIRVERDTHPLGIE